MAIVLPKLSVARPPGRTSHDAHPAVNITLRPGLGGDDDRYAPGDMLQARWSIRRVACERLTGVEASILWQTIGKGDEDLGVIFFQRYEPAELRHGSLCEGHQIEAKLPLAPLTYHGHLLRILWCVRVRLTLTDRRDVVAECPFDLVSAPPLMDQSNDEATESMPVSLETGGRPWTRGLGRFGASWVRRRR